MYPAERDKVILESLKKRQFMSVRDLVRRTDASEITIRRDLARLENAGLVIRRSGGAQLARCNRPAAASKNGGQLPRDVSLQSSPRNHAQKDAIGRAAALLCSPGEGVMIDGGSTTLQMCAHLTGLNLQVLTNSLHIVGALLNQPGTHVLVPGGQVLREQKLILAAAGDEAIRGFHARRLFMGVASIGPAGLMQADVLLVAAERRFMTLAEEIIVLADSSKFKGPSGNVVCPLSEIDVVVTDKGIPKEPVRMLERSGIEVIVV
jgi:DeoR family transcriptional regulator, ulaG and ulaABCDEF operon transcriptional repressor